MALFLRPILPFGTMSLLKISATVSTLIANLAPVWVGLLSYLILQKEIGSVILDRYLHRYFRYGDFSGISTIFCTCSLTSGYICCLNRQFVLCHLYHDHQRYSAKDRYRYFYVLQHAGSKCIFAGHLLISAISIGHFSSPTWLCFIGMGLICQLAGWITINYSLQLFGIYQSFHRLIKPNRNCRFFGHVICCMKDWN